MSAPDTPQQMAQELAHRIVERQFEPAQLEREIMQTMIDFGQWRASRMQAQCIQMARLLAPQLVGAIEVLAVE